MIGREDERERRRARRRAAVLRDKGRRDRAADAADMRARAREALAQALRVPVGYADGLRAEAYRLEYRAFLIG